MHRIRVAAEQGCRRGEFTLQDLKFRPGGEAQHPQFDHVKIFRLYRRGRQNLVRGLAQHLSAEQFGSWCRALGSDPHISRNQAARVAIQSNLARKQRFTTANSAITAITAIIAGRMTDKSRDPRFAQDAILES